MAAEPITVGVVGLGRIGWGYHLKELQKNPAFKIVACVDPVAERRKEAETTYGVKTFDNLDDYLKSGLAQLSIICTMSIDHAKHTLAALKAGHHVVVEKPMAMSVAEADKMIETAKKMKKVLTINQSHRARPEMRFVRELIDSKILGDVFFVRFTGHSFMRRHDWQTLKKNGGGYLNNWGAHSVDYCILLLDSPVKDVWADMKHTVSAGDADDWVKAVLRGKNGRVVECEFSYAVAIPQPTWLVAGTCGTCQVTGETATLKYFDPAKAEPVQIVDAPAIDRKYDRDAGIPWQEETRKVEPKLPYPDFYANLVEAIRNKGKLLVTPESVRNQVNVLDLIRKSSHWNWKK
jgi:scyllo-inositol 2-dehydrogenase (NADP+)